MLQLRFKRIEWASFRAQAERNGFNEFCQEASAHMLIEEAMITYNACCSIFLERKVRFNSCFCLHVYEVSTE